MTNNLLGVTIDKLSKQEVLDKILKNIKRPANFFHIVSINPEIVVITQENSLFKQVVNSAQIRLIDGVGIVRAAQVLGIPIGEKISGVDLMEELISIACNMRSRVLLIGGRPNLAVSLSNCYQQKYSQAKFLGVEGIKNIQKPTTKEENDIWAIVSDYKPHMIFTAFGSPEQELWLERHKDHFKGIVVMGVGGGFDFLSGEIKRAPIFIRKIGLEWLFRLILQPWRWRRQTRLIKFIILVLKQKINK